jgi:hypothetical protein
MLSGSREKWKVWYFTADDTLERIEVDNGLHILVGESKV